MHLSSQDVDDALFSSGDVNVRGAPFRPFQSEVRLWGEQQSSSHTYLM